MDWLNNQDAFLSEIDTTIEGLQRLVDNLESGVDAVNPFNPDVPSLHTTLEVRVFMCIFTYLFSMTPVPDVDFFIKNLGRQVVAGGKSVADFSTKIKEKFSSLKQVLPTSIGKSISNLEVDVERIGGNLEEKKQAVTRAAATRHEFKNDLDAVKKWMVESEDRLQGRSQEPHLLKEVIQSLQSQLPPIVDKFEKAQKNGGVIVDRTTDEEERASVKSALESSGAQLDRIKAAIDEKRTKVQFAEKC